MSSTRVARSRTATVTLTTRCLQLIAAGLSDKNPNVIYELGQCHELRRCPIPLVRNWADLPFNLRNLRYMEYENKVNGASVLREKLTATIQQFLAQVREETI